MNILKAILRFLNPLPRELFSNTPHEPRRFKYWEELHGGLMGVSAVLFWLVGTGVWVRYVDHWTDKLFPGGDPLHSKHTLIGALVIDLILYVYGLLMGRRFYVFVWSKLSPWFETKYKKPPTGGGGCQAI